MSRTGRRRHGGFTLIEIVLVCVMIGILVAIVAPSLASSSGRQHLDAAARAIVAFSRAARARASADGRAYFLIVDGTAKQVRIARQRDPLVAATQSSTAQDPSAAELEDDQWSDGAPWARPYDLPEDVSLAFASTTYEDVQTTTLAAAPVMGSSTTGALQANGLPAGVQAEVDHTKLARVSFNPEGGSDDATFDLVGAENAKVRIVIDSPSGRARILSQDELDAILLAAPSISSASGATPPPVLGTVAPLPSPSGGH